MNWLDFWASIVGSIASLGWPAAVFGGLYLFRSALRDAIPKLRLKHGETEISVQLHKAEQQAAQLPQPVDPVPAQAPEEIDNFVKLADISPRAALLEARASVEQAIREAARRANIPVSEKKTASALVSELAKRSLIDKRMEVLLRDLRVIGNAAAHDPNVGIKDDGALSFGRMANKVVQYLNAIVD